MKKINKYFFYFAIISIILCLGYYHFSDTQKDLKNLVPEVIPQAKQIEIVNKEPLVFEAKTNEKTLGYAVLEKATGYQSQIKVLVGVDLQGNIINTFIVEEQETPAFFQRLYNKDFFTQFIGKDIKEGFTLDRIDAISGSTISSRAVTKAVNLGTNYVARNYLNQDIAAINTEIVVGKKEIAIIILMIFTIYASYRRKAKLRNIALIYSIIVLGFWYNAFISYAAFGSILTGSLPNPPDNLAWYILVFGALGLILFTGKNLFCFWMCPFGAFQEILNKISGIRLIPARKITNIAKQIRGLIIWGTLILALVLRNTQIMSYEPFGALFGQTASEFQWLLLPILLFTAFLIPRFWCGYFCPVGYVLNLWLKLRNKGAKLWKNKKSGRTLSS